MYSRCFASDNFSGVHPEIFARLERANQGHVMAYGDDSFTEKAILKFKELLGKDIAVFFVFGGTGANCIGLKTLTESFHAIICAETAHIHVNECGAPEKFTGCKLLAVPTENGKLTVELISRYMEGIGDPHHVQPKVVSITQPTELGTLYTLEEVRKIADFAHQHQMFLHMDGARISNAVAALSVDLQKITKDAGVDVLSFGGTKNGMMFGEAIIFFNAKMAKHVEFFRKQGMQLVSKMRFVGAQFEALLSNDLWLKNARHANQMAKVLAEQLKKIPEVKITQKVETNAVFASLPKKAIASLQRDSFFYLWNAANSEVRWMTSFDTEKEDIDHFIKLIQKYVK